MPDDVQTVRDETAEPSLMPKRDFRQEVTNQIIEMLERGTAPWQKPWESGALQLPFNPSTNRIYRGGNALHLMAVAVRKGYEDPRWLTYRQAQENGWHVRKGEKGSQIEFWQLDSPRQAAPVQDANDARETSEHQTAGPMRRVYTVFNASQIEGISKYAPRQRAEWEIAESGESILKHSGAHIHHDQRDRAFYSRSEDAVHLPSQDAFRSAADYYGTALHELAHWTGHPSRLNRQTLNESYRFGDPNYAKEELRAELASVFLAAERGIPHKPEQHAAYVASWIQMLRHDKHEIFRAAKDAHKAADFILDLDKSRSAEKSAPQLRAETSQHVADFERGSSTVNTIEKETATEHRDPVPVAGKRTQPDRHQDAKLEAEKIFDGEVDGRRAPTVRDFERSLADAERRAKELLGEKVRVYSADTTAGQYRGEVLDETGCHLIQKLSPRSAVVHVKQSLPQTVQPGQRVLVSYSNNLGRVTPMHNRERSHALSR